MSTSNPQPGTSRCKSCGAPVLYVPTVLGKLMPLDADEVVMWQVGSDGTVRPVHVHRSHFATCPQGNQWRKRP